ncbi:hypothetical protein CEXT_362311 [Caerostris extrusa]|uniref:Uncharacterized protein n=1 Tax=Caerostris extrusa TaxID=172846 RepID=A0AAV4NBU6_CAEEX|nr:hypothetical protein CEXT_362311 [Caerostris extrusa]
MRSGNGILTGTDTSGDLKISLANDLEAYQAFLLNFAPYLTRYLCLYSILQLLKDVDDKKKMKDERGSEM